MSSLDIGWIGIGCLFGLLALRVSIGVALMIVSFVGIWFMLNLTAAFGIVSALPFNLIGDWSLTAIPMFLFMGFIAANTGMTSGAFDLLRLVLRRVPGGLASAAVGACGMFAAASGSSIATTAAMSRIAVPEMLKAGYHPSLATGVVAASGTLGSLIPPSILMVLYGIFTEQSIGKLFIAGIIPGVVSALIYAAMITIRCARNPLLAPSTDVIFDRSKLFRLVLSVWPFPVLVLGVLGGIFGGLFTPTEAGAVGASLALLVAIIRREATREALWLAIRQTVVATSSIFFLTIGAVMFTRFMGLSGVPQAMSDAMLAVSDNQIIIIIIMIAALYVVLGMFIDSIGLMLLTLPALLPVLDAADVNMIWFGIITIKLLEIGLITPPVGLNLYVLHSALAGRVRLGEIISGATWFVAMDLVTLALLIAFPAISLYLPSLMVG